MSNFWGAVHSFRRPFYILKVCVARLRQSYTLPKSTHLLPNAAISMQQTDKNTGSRFQVSKQTLTHNYRKQYNTLLKMPISMP